MKWDTFLATSENRPPRPLLVEALPFVGEKEQALDFGAGAMVDTYFLIKEGFKVTATDLNGDVHKYLTGVPNVTFVESSFDTYAFPEETYDLVNAQYALPFNPPETFEKMFGDLTRSLKTGGIFVGQFFGTEDGWADRSTMTFLSEADVQTYLLPYEVIVYREEKQMGKTVAGGEKFWHVFHVIARKK
jgi:tellurite methyltransferase